MRPPIIDTEGDGVMPPNTIIDLVLDYGTISDESWTRSKVPYIDVTDLEP